MEEFFLEAGRMLDYSYLEFLTQEILTDVTVIQKMYIGVSTDGGWLSNNLLE